MNKRKQGKEIVSKGEYVRRQASRGVTASMAVCLLVPAFAFAIWSLFCIFLAIAGLFSNALFPYLSLDSLGSAIILGGIAFLIFRGSSILIKEARTLDPGIPFTRANTTNLPAEESLVRASAEPVELQQAVLLRAASQSDATPADLLLRPATTEHADTNIQPTLSSTNTVWTTPREETQVQENHHSL